MRYLCPRIGMTVLFFLSVPGFREREYRVVFRIESDGGIEWYAFLPLEPLDESGGAGGEKGGVDGCFGAGPPALVSG